MASRVMHMAVASELSKQIEIQNMNLFILGSLAPDLIEHGTEFYSRSHFAESCEPKKLQGINWSKFADKYQREILTNDFLLGYYVHLITDACWIKRMQEKHIMIYPKEERNKVFEKGYRDLKMVNGYIIESYHLENTLFIPDALDQMSLEEIDLNFLKTLMNDVTGDFNNSYNKTLELLVYPLESITEFIREAIEKSREEVALLLTGAGSGNPQDYYIVVS